jgi:hypothetical protein
MAQNTKVRKGKDIPVTGRGGPWGNNHCEETRQSYQHYSHRAKYNFTTLEEFVKEIAHTFSNAVDFDSLL